ncbi:glycoside hydrolase family 172 protein [Nesterenkonia sp. K-15-9-6]|uniref:glycoside hydrolase family 172 protein n=1 Tax=Nesterenkonia sp. K-15-9-6 TaxID=3093918 RepID=UPI004043EE67
MTEAKSRSITAENPQGAPKGGAHQASRLGPGRKGRPCIALAEGETAVLADIDGPGVIRHMWFTLPRQTEAGPFVLRDLVLRITWDDAPVAAVEVPFGDFFATGFAEPSTMNSAAVVVAPTGGFNWYLPMPFSRSARIEVVNQHEGPVPGFFYQIDYSLEALPADHGYFHAQWRRSNATTVPGEDHVILDGVKGSGSYVGTFIGVTALSRFWWGEGEVKFYLDGDETHPTICGTGLEDYVGGAWGFQSYLGVDPVPRSQMFTSAYLGYHQRIVEDATKSSPYDITMPPSHGMYRWHLPDPVRFHDELRVTLQQIGDRGHRLFERVDDVCSTAYWYQNEPSGVAVSLPPALERAPR